MEDGKKMLETSKYPEYVQAVEDFLAANPKEGEIVTHEWLDEHLDLQPHVKGYALRKLSRVQGFKKELLTKYQIDLKNVLGQGYYVVPAVDQTEIAVADMRKKLAGAAKEGLMRCVNVRAEMLTDEQKAANQKAIEIITGISTANSRAVSAASRKRIASISAKPEMKK